MNMIDFDCYWWYHINIRKTETHREEAVKFFTNGGALMLAEERCDKIVVL